jgi:hypothetical protein
MDRDPPDIEQVKLLESAEAFKADALARYHKVPTVDRLARLRRFHGTFPAMIEQNGGGWQLDTLMLEQIELCESQQKEDLQHIHEHDIRDANK